jgi:sec-independent protein translocase protein TatB
MLNIGFSEILLFGIIALIVLGPEKLPIAVRTAGRWYAHIRRLVTNVQRDIEQELQLAEMREHMQKELDRIKSMEQSMQQQLDQMHDDLAELNPNAASHDERHQIKPTTPQKYSLIAPADQQQYVAPLTDPIKPQLAAATANTDSASPDNHLASAVVKPSLIKTEQHSPS